MVRYGQENHAWRGDSVGYSGVHDYVKHRKTKPRACQICHREVKLQLANISGNYTRDVADYMWACHSCNILKLPTPNHKYKDYLKDKNAACSHRGKKYRATHKDKCDEINRKYRQDNHDKIIASQKVYYLHNKERILDYSQKYYAQNKDEIKKKGKIYRLEHKDEIKARGKRYVAQNKEMVAAKKREWIMNNPDYMHNYYLTHKEKWL